jgi:cell division protein FtsL
MRRHRPSSRSWATPSLVTLGFAGLLSALSLVTWRQSRAFEALAELDRVERRLSLAESEQAELRRRIQGLDSRTRISSLAQQQLGMHRPAASEMRWLSGGGR